MLEQHELWLTPWKRDGVRASWTRALLEPTRRTAAGVALWEPLDGRRWLRWVRPLSIRVHEADDEPLLFTIQRVWGLGPRWEVDDADDHPVGQVRRRSILDRFGRCLGQRQAMPHGVRYHSPEGYEIALLTHEADGSRLQLGLALDGDPFAKMAVVAAALVEPVAPLKPG